MSKQPPRKAERLPPLREPTPTITTFAEHPVVGVYRPPEYLNPKFERWVIWFDRMIATPEDEEKLIRIFSAYGSVRNPAWDGYFWDVVPQIIEDYKLRRAASSLTWQDFNGIYEIYQLESGEWGLWTHSRIYGIENEEVQSLLLVGLRNSRSLADFLDKLDNLLRVYDIFPSPEGHKAIVREFKEDYEDQLLSMEFDPLKLSPQFAHGVDAMDDIDIQRGYR
jgi:hypothetical protein